MTDADVRNVPGAGYFECDITRPRKYRHESLEEAWLQVFAFFAETGTVLTPYYCARQTRRYEPEARILAQPNPWRWSPVWITSIQIRCRTWKVKPCYGWHLTRKTRHILTA